jgi:hypothetical protein
VPRGHAYPHGNCNSNSNGNGDTDSHGHCHCHCHAATYPDTKVHSSAKTAPHPSAASGLKPLHYQLYQRSNEN